MFTLSAQLNAKVLQLLSLSSILALARLRLITTNALLAHTCVRPLQMGKTVKALVRKGSALKEMKDFDQAQLVFTEALVMEPESAVVKKLMLETVKAKKAAAKEQDKIDGAIFAGAFGKK